MCDIASSCRYDTVRCRVSLAQQEAAAVNDCIGQRTLLVSAVS